VLRRLVVWLDPEALRPGAEAVRACAHLIDRLPLAVQEPTRRCIHEIVENAAGCLAGPGGRLRLDVTESWTTVKAEVVVVSDATGETTRGRPDQEEMRCAQVEKYADAWGMSLEPLSAWLMVAIPG
jgi:hypothetical protein